MMEFYYCEIADIFNETHDVKTFRLVRPENFIFKPGQHCLVKTSKNGVMKPFTFSNCPDEEFLELTIKVMGDFTQGLFMMKKGEHLWISDPKKSVYTFDEKIRQDVVFLTGGSGITPFISAIRYAAQKAMKNRLWLFFGNRSEKDIIYHKELERLNTIKNITIINVIEKPGNWKGETGYITKELILKHVKDPISKLWFVCGPPQMVAAIKNILDEFEIPESFRRIDKWELPGKKRT